MPLLVLSGLVPSALVETVLVMVHMSLGSTGPLHSTASACKLGESKVIAMAQIGVDFKHVLHCELDRDLRYLSQVLFERMGCPAYYMETDMVSRRPLAQPLDLYFLSTPCPTFSSAGKGEAAGNVALRMWRV